MGRLYDLGYYPGLVQAAYGTDEVVGELYRLVDVETVLADLDAYEGCGPDDPPPHEYRREAIDVRTDDGRSLRAWAYLYVGSLDGARLISNGDYAVDQRLTVRPERTGDHAAIDAVNLAAFGQENEGRLVRELRSGERFDPDLSLVAERAGAVVGHILFSPVVIANPAGEIAALALAPMAVVPALQGQGIGSEMVRHGLEACRRGGHRIVIVVGHPAYYPRFGFEPARARGLDAPFPVPDDAFLVLGLSPGALDGVGGVVRYPPAFESV